MAAEPTAQTVDVAQIIDAAPFRGLPVLVFAFTAIALVIDGFDVTAVAFVAPTLLTEWQLTRAELAPAIAAGLFGMSIGSLAMGTLGDRGGRRMLLCACLALAGAASFGCATAANVVELAAWRFVAGLGLGGALPNASALMAEYAPARTRSLVLAAVLVGLPLGSMLGAEVSAQLVPEHGWRIVFVLGGILPLAIAGLLWIAVPESPRFLARHPTRRAELQRVLARLGAGPWLGDVRFVVHEAGADATQGSLRDLWSPAFRRDTLALWVAFAAGLFVVYAIGSWLPTVLAAAGLPLASALRGSVAFNLGGVFGSLLVAWAMTRLGSRPVLLVTVALGIAAAIALALLPVRADALVPLVAAIALAGASLNGGVTGLYPVAAHVYPTALRATGVGWSLGVSRFAAVLSAFAGSAVLALGTGTAPFFLALAAVLGLMLVGVALVRRHVARAATRSY